MNVPLTGIDGKVSASTATTHVETVRKVPMIPIKARAASFPHFFLYLLKSKVIGKITKIRLFNTIVKYCCMEERHED